MLPQTRSPRSRRALVRVVMIALAGAIGACRHQDAAPADSALSRDLALANQPSSPISFQDTAITSSARPAPAAAPERAPSRIAASPSTRRANAPAPKPSAPAPAPISETPAPTPTPAPAPAAAPTRTIGAGTAIAMTTGSRVCASSNRPGDKIVATVDSPITGSDGAVIPAGARMVLEVASVAPDQSQITFRLRALVLGEQSYPVSGEVSSTTPLEKARVAGNGSSDKKKVIGGAIAGAILGQILGKDTKSTVIGAATGAAAGAVAAKAGEKVEGCLPAGAPLHVTLSQPIVMS